MKKLIPDMLSMSSVKWVALINTLMLILTLLNASGIGQM